MEMPGFGYLVKTDPKMASVLTPIDVSLQSSHLHRKNCIAESYALKLDCPVLGTSVTFANCISVSFSEQWSTLNQP